MALGCGEQRREFGKVDLDRQLGLACSDHTKIPGSVGARIGSMSSVLQALITTTCQGRERGCVV